jgi:hypothetical protein
MWKVGIGGMGEQVGCRGWGIVMMLARRAWQEIPKQHEDR